MRAFGTESPLLLQQGCLRRWDAGSIRGNPAFASAARRIFRSTALTLGILLAVTGAVAQTGSITVLVTDCAGQPLPGAVVIISHATGAVKTTDRTTDKTGRVDFPVLRAGRGYSIEVSLSGFRPDRWDDLRVAIGETVALTTPLIQAGESSDGCPMLGPSVQRTNEFLEFVADLPMRSRVYQNVLALDPGVQDTAGDGNLNVHGSRSRDFQAVVSGVGNVDPSTGRWLGRINLNSIEEMEVVTAGAGVEFGRAQGGFTRIVQKQGGNTHEGVFEFYWQTSKLDGNGAADSSAGPDPEFETYQPFFQFSGPVIEDRLWYRASYDRRDAEVPVNVLTGLEVLEWDTESTDAQLTWQASPRNKLALNFRTDPAEGSNLGISNWIGLQSSRALERDVETRSANWTAVQSPRALVDTVVAWQDIVWTTTPATTELRNDCVPYAAESFLSETYCSDLSRSLISGSWYRAERDHRERLTVKSRSIVYAGRFWGADHRLKLGIEVENERYSRSVAEQPFVNFGNVRVEVGSDGGIPEPDEEPSLLGYGQAISWISAPASDRLRATGTNGSLFAEDQFKPSPRLTVTLGARVDREEINSGGWSSFDPSAELASFIDFVNAATTPAAQAARMGMWPEFFTGYGNLETIIARLQDLFCEGKTGADLEQCRIDVASMTLSQSIEELESKRKPTNIHLSNTNVSSFLSLGWSPWADGKTAFRASAGRHYDTIPLVVPLQELEPVHTPLEYRTSLLPPDQCPPPDPNDPNPPGVGCGKFRLVGGIEPAAATRMVDRDLATPYQDEFTLKFERELWAETSLSLAYVRRNFRDQLQDVNVNLGSGDLGRCIRQTNPVQPHVARSPGTSAMSCSATPVACQSDGDCPTGESCGFFFDLGGPTGWLTDPYSEVKYPDTNPSDGDGFMDPVTGSTDDNCSGIPLVLTTEDDPCGPGDPFCDTTYTVRRPDDRSDLYVQNPFWGDLFLIGNLNSIDYEAVVLELVRRQYRSWEMNASYTWSETRSEGEDFLQELMNDSTLHGYVAGFQPYDQTHVVKLNATTITPWGFRLGTSITWQSGLPYSVVTERLVLGSQAPITSDFGGAGLRPRQTYPTGARNDQRNDAYWNIDLKATKELQLGKGMNLQLMAEVFNLLDDGTYQIYNPYFGRGMQINGRNEALRRFGRSWQLGVRVGF